MTHSRRAARQRKESSDWDRAASRDEDGPAGLLEDWAGRPIAVRKDPHHLWSMYERDDGARCVLGVQVDPGDLLRVDTGQVVRIGRVLAREGRWKLLAVEAAQ